MEVQFLGSGDAFGSGGRLNTCLHVRCGSTQFLVDCGASGLIAMKRSGIDPAGVGLIVLSHLHGDHFGGLPFVILDAHFGRRARPLVVAGPPGTEARVRQCMDVMFPGSSGLALRFPLEFVELADRTGRAVGAITVTPFTVIHASGAPAFALRILCGGRVLAYSGDTEWTDALLEAARDADLFVCEAYAFEAKIGYHLDYHTVRERRADFACRRLILTHMGPDVLRRLQDLDIEWADDGRRIVL